jgi:glycolate oxidase
VIREQFVTNEELIQEARRRCAQGAWDYLVGGSESETTLRRNRQAFDKIAFRPRVLVDVSNVDTSTALLGQKLRIPAILAPIGSLQVFDPAGAVASTQAATDFGIMHCVSSATLPALEETAAATPTPKIFQLYVHGDDEWTSDMIRRIKGAGYVALALTVDVAHYSRRERPMLSRYQPPTRRVTTTPQRSWLASLTWEKMDQIKAEAGLPFMLKGVQTAEDAEIAVEHGVDYIWVSNHGGRHGGRRPHAGDPRGRADLRDGSDRFDQHSASHLEVRVPRGPRDTAARDEQLGEHDQPPDPVARCSPGCRSSPGRRVRG